MARDSSTTQKARVLQRLADGEWHSTLEFIELGVLRVSARVFELRRSDRVTIDVRRRTLDDGQVVFEYRWPQEPAGAA